MRSLRARLILISTLVSGAAVAALGFLSWQLMISAMRESTDLRLEGIAGRLLRDVNPWSDADAMRDLFETGHGDELAIGALALSARAFDEGGPRVIGESGWTDGIEAALPDTFPVPDPNPVRRPQPRPGGPRVPGRPPGGPERPGEDPGMPPERRPPHHEEGPRLVEYIDVTIAGEQWRFIAAQERGYGILAGLNFTRANPGLVQLRRGFLLGTPLSLCLVGLGGWFVAERAMRPLRRISATARRISASALGERMPQSPHSDPEIAQLTSVLNAMMARLEISFAHASRFSADVSHELKTPITVMQGEIESALRECSPGSHEESTLVVLRGELGRLKSIIGSLLMLSRADVGNLIRRRETFSLSRELEALAEDAEILCENAGVRFSAEIAGGLEVEGDAVLLRQALLNLLYNGVKFNIEEGYVRVSAERTGGEIVVAVENSGPGIAEEDRPRIFDRFYRSDRSRSRDVDGFGLGLSLAKVIVEAHEGTLVLEDASPGRTRFVLRLP